LCLQLSTVLFAKGVYDLSSSISNLLGRKIRNAPSIKPWNVKSPGSRFLRVVLKDDAEKRIHFFLPALIAAWAAARRAIGTRNGEQLT
jgi:hypothetical protein